MEKKSFSFDEEESYVNPLFKYGLFAMNIVFWLISIALLAVGIHVLLEKEKRLNDSLDFFIDPACWITLSGAVMFVISFFGWVGALREMSEFLKTYYWTLRVLLLLQIFSGVFMLVVYNAPTVKQGMLLRTKAILGKAIEKYRDDEDLETLINHIQIKYQCCGIGGGEEHDSLGFRDWSKNIYFHCSDENISVERCSVPASCCDRRKEKVINMMCGRQVMKQSAGGLIGKIHGTGCLYRLLQWVERNSRVLCGLAFGLLFPQFVLACLGQKLNSQIHRQKYWPPRSEQSGNYSGSCVPPYVAKIVNRYRSQRPCCGVPRQQYFKTPHA